LGEVDRDENLTSGDAYRTIAFAKKKSRRRSAPMRAPAAPLERVQTGAPAAIASEAKQMRAAAQRLDRRVASLLAMTVQDDPKPL